MANFRFLTYNLWYSKNWREEIDFIKKQNPDILTLQEITKNIPKFDLDNTDVFREFEKALSDYKGVVAPISRKLERGREIYYANAIFSKFPIISSKIHYYLKPLDWTKDYDKQSRNLTEVKLNVGNKELFIYTAHFNYAPEFKDTEIKIKEAKKVSMIIKGKRPMIFAGDLNSYPGSKVINTISQEATYIDKQNRPTWTKHPFSYRGFNENKLNWKLDYVFISRELSCKEFRLVDVSYSDHLPIVVDFELKSL